MYCTKTMNQESDSQESDEGSCVVKWDSGVEEYEPLVGTKGRPTMTQQVEAMMSEQDSEDSSESDDSDNDRGSLKRADHHNRRSNTLTQFLINDDAKDSELMEIDLDELQSVQNGQNDHARGNDGSFTQYLREENDDDDIELLNIDLSNTQSLPPKSKEKDATPKINSGNKNADQFESTAFQLTFHQRQQMEENRVNALAKLKGKNKIMIEQRQRMEDNRVKALAKRKANARIASGRAKSIGNGHGTKNYSSSASVVVSPPLSRSNFNNVPMLHNGKILIVRGAQHGDATVAMDESVVLVRDPHNVSLFLCQKN